jgi:hypothetical protein
VYHNYYDGENFNGMPAYCSSCMWRNSPACLNNVMWQNNVTAQTDGYRSITPGPLSASVGAVPREGFTSEEARRIGIIIGINWNASPFNVEHFRRGLDVELEHGRISPATNVTGDDPIMTGKIALAHLNEFPDYYTRLKRMEDEAKAYWRGKRK